MIFGAGIRSWACRIVWCAQLAALSIWMRGGVRDVASCLALAGSVAIAAVALLFASKKRGPRAIASLVVAIVIVTNVGVHRYFHKGIDAQLVLSAKYNFADVRPVLKTIAPWLALAIAATWVVEFALLTAARAVATKRTRLVALALAIAAIVLVPARAATAEVQTGAALVTLASSAHGNVDATPTPVKVPVLVSVREHPPNVLFVLLESVRYSSYCPDPNVPCDVAPKTHALFDGGVAFREARSVASYTAVSFGALTTGLPQWGTKADLQSMPTLFEYLHSARINGSRPTVAYFSSQSESVFERPSARDAIDAQCTVETLVGHAVADEDDVIDLGVDRLLADRVATELPKLAAPYFAFVHVSGTHAPYFVDDARAPKKPYVRYASWSKLDDLKNAYDDAIFTQDESVARMIETFRAAQKGAPWIVILTSDHGEAFGEHQAIHHGQSLYDEQIHVPLLFAFGGGAIEDEAMLRANATKYVTHLDVLPTVLDAFGLGGAAPLKSIAGQSLLSLRHESAPIPITNCTAMFPCPVSTWGMLADARVLTAQPWDYGFHCLDLATQKELAGDPACDLLRTRSRDFFPTLPYGAPNR